MDVVEKAESLYWMYYLHGKIADMNTPTSSPTPRLPVDT